MKTEHIGAFLLRMRTGRRLDGERVRSVWPYMPATCLHAPDVLWTLTSPAGALHALCAGCGSILTVPPEEPCRHGVPFGEYCDACGEERADARAY